MRRRRVVAAAVVLVCLTSVPAGADERPALQPGHDTEVGGLLASGWDGLLDIVGVPAQALTAALGVSPDTRRAVPELPAALVRELTALPGLEHAGLTASWRTGDEAEDPETPEEPETSPWLSARQTADITGNGIAEVWAVGGGGSSPATAVLADGATGQSLWARSGRWSSSPPVPLGDVNDDGTVDLAALRFELLDVVEIDEQDGDLQRVGFEFEFASGIDVVSGATGVTLWSERGVERFGLEFRLTQSATEWWFGIGIWLENALRTPQLMERSGDADHLVVQRVDQQASAEIGGRGVYAWDTGLPVGGVNLTDRMRTHYQGATRAHQLDARDGAVHASRALTAGDEVAFLDVLTGVSPDAAPGLLWTTYTIPAQHVECVWVCIDTFEPTVGVTLEVEDASGLPLWQAAYGNRYALDVWVGGDLDGDAVDDIVLWEAAPDGGSFDVSLAVLSGTDGQERWRTSLGAADVWMAGIQAWNGSGSLLLLSEVLYDQDGVGVRVHRLDGVDGSVLPSSEHRIAYQDGPGPIATEPYVWATVSAIWLNVGGDTDGDGHGDVLVSLAQIRYWSDDRPPTYWGSWTVESGRSGHPIHTTEHDEPPRVISGWTDTSGDGYAEFVESISIDQTFLLDGATSTAVWELPPEHVRPVSDLNHDGVDDMLLVSPSAGAVTALDGPSRTPVWTLHLAD